jgi:hypothetical protein
MRCTKCGSDNGGGEQSFAGSVLRRYWRNDSLWRAQPARAKFCDECGAPLHAIRRSPPAISPGEPETRVTAEQPETTFQPEGERKTVTALFADIKESMELMEGLNPKRPVRLSIQHSS